MFKRKTISPAVATILRLLRRPEDWAFDEFYATHIGGARIWISNADYKWAREVSVPGVGVVLQKGRDCKAGADHRAVDAAVWKAQQAILSAGMTKYVLRVESERERRERTRREEARRLAYDAERLAAAAEEARRLSASMLAEMEPLSGSAEGVAAQVEGEGSRETVK